MVDPEYFISCLHCWKLGSSQLKNCEQESVHNFSTVYIIRINFLYVLGPCIPSTFSLFLFFPNLLSLCIQTGIIFLLIYPCFDFWCARSHIRHKEYNRSGGISGVSVCLWFFPLHAHMLLLAEFCSSHPMLSVKHKCQGRVWFLIAILPLLFHFEGPWWMFFLNHLTALQIKLLGWSLCVT